MPIARAVRLFDLAERYMRNLGACSDVVELYESAAAALLDAGQTYLASIALHRAALVASLA